MPFSDQQYPVKDYLVGDWILGSLIGKWRGGDIWFASHRHQSGLYAAVKIEYRSKRNSHKASLLSQEHNVYKSLGAKDKKLAGFQKLLFFEMHENRHVLVLDYLHWSLEHLLLRFDSLRHKTVMMIGIQALGLLSVLHEKGWVHGDVCPENFFFGAENPTLHLGNFHSAKSFRSRLLRVHVPRERDPERSGSLHFKSRDTHSKWTASRRDDLESLGYVLVHAYHGKLPWSMLGKKDDKEVLKLKKEVPLKKLCKGMSRSMRLYFKHVMTLDFSEKPDYELLTEILRNGMISRGQNEDFEYEWNS